MDSETTPAADEIDPGWMLEYIDLMRPALERDWDGFHQALNERVRRDGLGTALAGISQLLFGWLAAFQDAAHAGNLEVRLEIDQVNGVPRARVLADTPRDADQETQEVRDDPAAMAAIQADQADPDGRETVPLEDVIRPRPPVAARAGSVLNADTVRPVLISKGGPPKMHGLIDPAQKLYQHGGEAHNFIYRKRGWVTLDAQVWEEIKHLVEWIEIVDHTTNTVYRIAASSFHYQARYYNAGAGPRMGVPLEYWAHLDSQGRLLDSKGEDHAD